MKPLRIADDRNSILAAWRPRDRLLAGLHGQAAGANSVGRVAARPITLPACARILSRSLHSGVPDSYAGVTAFTRLPGSGRMWSSTTADGRSRSAPASLRGSQARRRTSRSDRPRPRQPRRDRIRAVRRLPDFLRPDAVRAYRHPVILGFGHEMNGSWRSWSIYAHLPGGVRRRLAPHRQPVPQPRSGERHLAVDGQRHRSTGRHSLPGAVVARQRVRYLGGH